MAKNLRKLLVFYYVVIALVATLLIAGLGQNLPNVPEASSPVRATLIVLFWVALLTFPLLLLPRLQRLDSRRIGNRLSARKIRAHAPIILLIAYEATVILMFASRIMLGPLETVYIGEDQHLEAAELILWVFLLFLPVLVPYVQSLNIALPGGTKVELKRLREEMQEERRRIDEVRYDAQRVIHSLTSLLFTPQGRLLRDVDDRLRNRRTVLIGCAEFTEQRLLCAMIAGILHGSGAFAKVIPRYNLGGAAQNFVALARGGIDILPAYTWTGFELLYPTLLAESEERKYWIQMDPDQQVAELNKVFNEKPYPLEWITLLGFRNDWNLIMRKDDAAKKKIAKISDLHQWTGELRLACERDFYFRLNGLGIVRRPPPSGYGIQFKSVELYDHREVYRVLRDGDADVIDGFTTDPEIEGNQFQVLEDDRKGFGAYHAALVARKGFLEICEDVCPEIREHLGKLAFGPSELKAEETSQERWERELRQMIRNAERPGDHILKVKEEAERFLNRRGIT